LKIEMARAIVLTLATGSDVVEKIKVVAKEGQVVYV
jgi:hypothetical protein